jgi:thiamine pyrophosphate-dependent acetolactate synthase large subunit-like protein
MSAATIKRHNHRVLHCNTQRKIELANFLLKQYSDLKIAIVSKDAINGIEDIALNENVKIMTDSDLATNTAQECDLLISLDLPNDPQVYIKRLDNITSQALIILDPDELAQLYPVEIALGRSLIQETLKEFETTQSKEQKILEAKQKKKEKRYEKENLAKKEKQIQSTLKKLPPKRNVRKVAPKKEE